MLFSFISIFAVVLYVEAAEVYLTVENVACAENASAMLICEGVDLVSLRWSYISSNSSKNVELLVFLADHSNTTVSNTTVSSNPAFLSVKLVTVSQYPDMETPANFSSVLTVDLLELENQDITSITCGDVATHEESLVSDIIFNTKITANYQLGVLTSMKVQLRNLLKCSSILMYSMTINGSDEAKNVKNCVGPFCEARFSSIKTSAMGDYAELLLAVTLRKRILMYRFPVGHRSKSYFSNEVNSTNCLHSAGCTVVEEGSICSIRHTAPSDQPISGMTMLNIPHSSSGTDHKFEFSMEANINLRINENISVTDGIPFGLKSTAILSTTSLFLLLTVIHFVLLLIGAFCKVKIFVSIKKSLVASVVIVLVLLFICISSIFVFGIISYGTQCSQIRMTLHDSMLVTMLVLSCLGITILITIWNFIGYGVYKHCKSTLRSENRDLRNIHDSERDAYCKTQRRNAYLSQAAASSSSKDSEVDMRSRDCEKKSQYDMLERPLTNRFSSYSCDVRNDFYGTLNEEALIELRLGGAPYEQLRPSEKSRPVPNLTDSSYSHIAKRKSSQISTVPDVVSTIRSDHMRDDYDVLGRQSINFQDATNSSRLHSFYEELSQASIEPLGAGLYLQLRHGEKSKPVPNMDDPTYSHVDKVEEPQVKPKK